MQQILADCEKHYRQENAAGRIQLNAAAGGNHPLITHDLRWFAKLHEHIDLESIESVDAIAAATSSPP